MAKKVQLETVDQVGKQWHSRGNRSNRSIMAGSLRSGSGWFRGRKSAPVDDLSEFLVKAAVTEKQRVVVDGVDDTATTARFFMGAADASRDKFTLPALQAGEVTGRLRSSFP